MNKSEIYNILQDWNFWNRNLDTGIDRLYYVNKIHNLLSSEQIIVVKGARRVGKSFIIRQFIKSLIDKDIPPERTLMINFEDPRFVELNTAVLEDIYKTYLEFVKPNGLPYIFLDEVQEVDNWEKWVRMMHELNKARIFISGSNAHLLSRELSTLLTGRHIDITVLPLSFKEFTFFCKIDNNDIISGDTKTKTLLREYLEFGAFPKIVLSAQKKELLLDYFEDIINRDLIRIFNIRKSDKLKSLAKYYLSNISTLTTYRSVEKFLDISVDTIEKFSEYLESAYLLYFVKRFSYKVKEQENSPRKVYAIDTGLANAIGFRFLENMGRIIENIVFLELKRRQIENPTMEISYWKDSLHREADFVIKYGLNVTQIIQVCWQIDDIKTKEREIKSLCLGMEESRLNEGIVITEDYEAVTEVKDCKICFIPLWKWLC